jgi:hypothetical protein
MDSGSDSPISQSSKCFLRNSNQDTQQSDSRHACCQAPKDAAQDDRAAQVIEVAGRTVLLCTTTVAPIPSEPQ